MWLNETIKKLFLKQPQNYVDYYQDINPDKIQNPLSNPEQFLDNAQFFDVISDNNTFARTSNAYKQADKINTYRMISKYPEVSEAIDEIINELIYTNDFKNIINIRYNGTNKKLHKILNEKFEKLYKLLNIEKKGFQFFREVYIDGQLNLKVNYHENYKNGIKFISYLDPRYLSFDLNKEIYEYIDIDSVFNSHYLSTFFWRKNKTQYNKEIKMQYNIEEIVHQNFGLTDGEIWLGYLDNCVKSANQLKTLEDLLIPLRFNRSVSRRVFNLDVSDLPQSKAEAYMRKIQEQFKYKKYYNSDTGEVANQQHMTSLIEDYWFSNRGGQKGMSVELLDERGQLGDLDDILYFYKKLYRSLNIPQNRINIDGQENVFDYDSTQLSNEDLKFQMFISRVRTIFINMFVDLLKRELVYTKILKESEFDEILDDIEIYFTGQNLFLERLQLNNFIKKIDSFSQARDFAGVIFPVNTLFKEIFRMDDDEIKQNLQMIQKEKQNPLYKHFYKDLVDDEDRDHYQDNDTDNDPDDNSTDKEKDDNTEKEEDFDGFIRK